MNAKLVRETPPTAAGRKQSSVYNNMVELYNTPGEWGRIAEPADEARASGMVSDLRRRQRKVPHPEANWEFVWGTVPRSDPVVLGVWARCNPETDPEVDPEEDDDE